MNRSERHPEPVGPSTEIATLQVADIELPPEMERLRDLAYDLWWSWSPQATRLFTWIDPDHWRRYLGIVLDGLRAEAATPLPRPALTRRQLDRVQQARSG